MRKIIPFAATLVALNVGAASAADLSKVYTKAPPVAVVSPWDVAFGAAITNNYLFRGVSQSNRNGSVAAYFEPRYNINPNLQLYAGVAGESISFTNRAAAEVDIYGGIRPTFGALALDVGVWGYLYPGGQCIGACPGSEILANGNIMKKDASFYEAFGKATYTFNDYFALGGTVFYSPDFFAFGTEGTYASVTGKVTAPTGLFGTSGVGAFVSGEFGRQWLGTTDAFYGLTKMPDYNTWNVGLGFTYKVFTLDLRYSDTDLNKGDCNAFTSDFTALQTGSVTTANPGGFGSKWCGSSFVARLSADVTLSALK